MVSFSPPGFVATSRSSCSRTVHGGVIQLSGLYALASACTAIEPSAFSMIRRSAGGSRAPRRPSYSTEQLATSMRTAALYHRCTARAPLATSTMPPPAEWSERGCWMVVLGTYGSDLYKVVLVAAHLLRDRRLRRRVPQRDLRQQEVQKRPGSEGIAVLRGELQRRRRSASTSSTPCSCSASRCVGLSDPVWKFSQTWVWLAIVLYIVALGISHGVLFPR